MTILKAILIAVLSILGVYLFFRLAGLAIAKSWKQVVLHEDCSNNKCKYNEESKKNRTQRKE